MIIKRLGAIDIGSNSVRLLITDVLNYNGNIIFKKDSLIRVPLKLGADTFSLGYISDEKKEKLALLMGAYRSLMDVNGVSDYRVCATSALREAENSDEVIGYVKAKSGVGIDIIDCKEEARYLIANNIDNSPERNRVYLFADVGGGCTELVIFYENEEIVSDSFRLGTVRPLSDEQVAKEWERMKVWLEEKKLDPRKTVLIGSGGNINKLNSLLRRCGRIKREELIAYARKLRNMSYEERLINIDMNVNRADVLLPAIDIYLRIMKMVKVFAVEIPVIGVADGIVKDLYMKKYAELK